MSATPIKSTENYFQVWSKEEIYTGPSGTGVYVPKAKDLVIEIVGSLKTEYLVLSVDQNTLLSTLLKIDGSSSDGLIKENALFATAGSQNETYLAYLDKSVTPHRLTIDARLLVAGSEITYYKVFSGYNVNTGGTVISALYDGSGNFIGENVGLEPAGTVLGKTITENIAIKSPLPCYTNANLADADVLTYVMYDADGNVRDIRQVYVKNTAAVRDLNAASKEIVDISIRTPFLASVNSSEILYPLNVGLNSLNLEVVIDYSDGSQSVLAVDGTRCKILGLDSYAPTIVGQRTPVTLVYQLQVGEQAYGLEGQNANHISRQYTIITQAAEGRYAVQLQVYPQWAGENAGYTLKWWIHDLQRSIRVDVTSQVVIDNSYTTYLPKAYGTKQTLKAVINLNDVNPSYAEFYHVQFVDVLLSQPETNRPAAMGTPNWKVAAVSGASPMFNTGVYCTFYQQSLNNNKVKIFGDYSLYEDWLQAYYTDSLPLSNPAIELAAPEPTHFILKIGSSSAEYPISQWNAVITVTQAMTNNSMAFVSFIKRTSDADLELSTIGIAVRAVNSNGAYI